MRTHLSLIILISFVFAGCSTMSSLDPFGLFGSSESAETSKTKNKMSESQRAPDPWQLWNYGKALNGAPLKSEALLNGDKLHRKGDLKKALAHYQAATRQKLSPQDRESLFVRLASTELSLGQPRAALSAISKFYGGDAVSIETVRAPFALVLAFGYSEGRELDQGLAWFNQAYQSTRGQGEISLVAKAGIQDVLRKAPDDQLNGLSPAWTSDLMVGELIGLERKRREQLKVGPNPFETAASLGQTTPSAPVQAGTLRVGLLLPLSGPYASLGKNVKNGFALASEANGGESAISIVEHDSETEGTTPRETVKSLVSSDAVKIVVGPLISSEANDAAAAARENGIPMLAFSKQLAFQSGRGVYRLGTTSRGQVNSLVDACANTLNMKRFALVYPDNSTANEYSQEFKRALNERNLELVYEHSYPDSGNEELIGLSEDVVKSGAEGVFIPDNASRASKFLLAIPEENRNRIVPLGTALWDDTKQLKNNAGAMHGAVFPTVFFAQGGSPESQQFIDAYKAKYGTSPDLLAAQGFDAAMLLIGASKAAVANGTSLVQELDKIQLYGGLTGSLSVLSDGEIQRKYKIVVFKKGQLKDLETDKSLLQQIQVNQRHDEELEKFSADQVAADGY